MARGVEKSLRAVILEARGTHKPEKIGFVEALFFSRFSESKRGDMPRGEYREMACGPLKEDKRRYEMDYVPIRKKMKIF